MPEIGHTLFYCGHCYDLNDSSKLFKGSIENVYQHWVTIHKDDSKPFEFYAIALLTCFHCDTIGIYHDLIKHHKEQHSDQQFVIIDRMEPNKCGICQYKDGSDLINHFKIKHNSAMKLTCINPISYSEQRIDELLSIKLHPNFDNEQNQPVHFICILCKKKVKHDAYLNHFNEHEYTFECKHCIFRSNDFPKLVIHEKQKHNIESVDEDCLIFLNWIKNKFNKTKLVFGNGLILQTWNVIGTKFDESEQFDDFIGVYMNNIKVEAKRILQRNRINPATANNLMMINAEFRAQRKLANSVFVSGISAVFNDIDPYELFLKICQKLELNVHVHRADIKDIQRHKNGFAVKFHQIELKERVLNGSKHKSLLSTELIQLEENQEPSQIRIRMAMTRFYNNLWNETAKFHEKYPQNFSCKMTDNGIEIMSKATSSKDIINTKDELEAFIAKNQV